MLRLIAWSIHFCARAATSMNAYGDSWNDVLYTSLTWCGMALDPLDVALRAQERLTHLLPQAALLEVLHEVAVDLEELARARSRG